MVDRLPGQVRLQVPGWRNDRRFFNEIRRRLCRLRSVKDVRTNPVTGSAFVAHRGEVADVAKQALGSEAGELADLVLNVPPVARRLRSDIASIDGAIQQFAGGAVDPDTLDANWVGALAGCFSCTEPSARHPDKSRAGDRLGIKAQETI